MSPRIRNWRLNARAVACAAALAAVATAAAGCSAYRVTCQNPYPEKTSLRNPHVELRNVEFSSGWQDSGSWRYRAERISQMAKSRFPGEPDRQGGVFVDAFIRSESSIVESDDIGTAVATQGVLPTETKTRRGETVTLKFYDRDGTPAFEKQGRTLKMTDHEMNSILGLAWLYGKAKSGWSSEEMYINRRYEILRDAILGLLDTPDVIHASAMAARARSGIAMTAGEPISDQLGPVGQRWAVVVGISEYEHAGALGLENLRYARRDAEGVYNELVGGDGTHWPKENVLLLTDKRATRAALNDALFNFLKKAQKDDFVLFFFSGHGSLDPARPANSYFLCRDTDPRNLAATGLPVWEIANAMRRGVIEARRVAILADACHSGGAQPEGIKDIAVVPGNVSEGVVELGQEGGRIRAISSSAAGEFSQERAEWGGGHGAFAWAVIEGLSGKADSAADKNSVGDADGKIDLNELAHYTRRRVGDLTDNAQHVQDTGGLNVTVKFLRSASPVSLENAQTE